MAKTDYERMTDQFRGQLEELWNKRKVDQLRGQIDDLRRNIDDLVKSYNRVLTTGADLLGETQQKLARQARESMVEVTEQVGERGFSWWIPVAVIGAIGAAVWIYNQVTASTTREGQRQSFTNFPAGSPPPMSSPEMPFPEQR